MSNTKPDFTEYKSDLKIFFTVLYSYMKRIALIQSTCNKNV